jgi:hypothetical protein
VSGGPCWPDLPPGEPQPGRGTSTCGIPDRPVTPHTQGEGEATRGSGVLLPGFHPLCNEQDPGDHRQERPRGPPCAGQQPPRQPVRILPKAVMHDRTGDVVGVMAFNLSATFNTVVAKQLVPAQVGGLGSHGEGAQVV